MGKLTFTLCVSMLFIQTILHGQFNWNTEIPTRYFVQNAGQFEPSSTVGTIHYMAQIDGFSIAFSDNEITYTYQKPLFFGKEMRKKKKAILYGQMKKIDLYANYQFRIRLEGAQKPQVELQEPLEFTSHYFVKDSTIQAKTCQRIYYRDVYPGIDMVFTLPENGGIKYDFIVHAGADASLIQVSYPDATSLKLDNEGNLLLKTTDKTFTEKNLMAYDKDNRDEIPVSYAIQGNTVKFNVEKVQTGHDLVIDPWVTAIAQPGELHYAWNLDWDSQGNMIVETFMTPAYQVKVMKFNSSGELQWVFNTSYIELGDLTTNRNTNEIYYSEGHANATPVLRLSPTGIQTAIFPYNGGVDNLEFWRMEFDRCNNQILMGLGGPMNSFTHGRMLPDLSAINNLEITPLDVQQDVNCIEIDPDGLTAYSRNSYGRIYKTSLPGFNVPIWQNELLPAFIPENMCAQITNGFGWTSTNGFNGLAANRDFVFEYNGIELVKRNKTTGAILGQLTVGIQLYGLGGGGIDADLCGNVFVGVAKTVRVYNENLGLTSTINLPDTCYDVKLYKGNLLYVSGRDFVAQIDITPFITNTYSITSVDAHCNSCDGSATVNVCQNTNGYTFYWSPSGQTTQTAIDLCPGTHQVSLIFGCDTVYQISVVITGTTSTLTLDLGNDTIICSGNIVLDAGVGADTYLWQDGSTNQTFTVTTSGTYHVMVTDLLGCELFDTIQVLVGEIPVDLGPDSTFCDQVDFVLDAGWINSIYVWQDASVNQQFNALNPGTYWVTVDSAGCIGSDTIVLSVLPSPVISVPDEEICIGSTVALNATGATTYSWSPGTGLSAITGATVNANPVVTTTYTIIGTTSGCSDTTTATVTVHPLPVITVNSLTICKYFSGDLTAAGADTYSWSPATGLSATTGTTVTANPLITTTYTITGIDINGCSNTTQVTVVVEDPTITVNDAIVCAGDPNDIETLTASGASTYEWSPATGLSATTGASVQANPTVTTIYTVIGTTLSGCKDTVQSTVTVVPAFTVTVNSDSICAGQSTLLTANGATTYTWSPPIGLNATTGVEVIASPSSTQTYTVTGTTNGCSEMALAVVTVIPVPNATIYATPNPVSSSDPVVTFSTPNTEGPLSWYHNNLLISQLNQFTMNLPETPGNFVVQLVVTNILGCPDTSKITVVIQEDIIFYVPNSFTPNGDPFNNGFYPVITSGVDEASYELLIYDRWGELVFETNTTTDGWDGTYKGKSSQDGTYTWTIKFKSKYTDEVFEHVGHVVLLK